jgi:hypothetical protein
MKSQPDMVWTDELGRDVLDVTATANRAGHLRAERKERMALVLHKLAKPVTCSDGHRRSFQVEEALLSVDNDNELACVRCSEFNYYSAKELAPYLRRGKPLFSFVPFN